MGPSVPDYIILEGGRQNRVSKWRKSPKMILFG